jgi:hypothetical protein
LVFPDGVEFVARVGFDRAVAVGQLLALHIPSDAILILRTDPPT